MEISLIDLRTTVENTYICPVCFGEGEVMTLTSDNLDQVDCPACNGEGVLLMENQDNSIIRKLQEMHDEYSAV